MNRALIYVGKRRPGSRDHRVRGWLSLLPMTLTVVVTHGVAATLPDGPRVALGRVAVEYGGRDLTRANPAGAQDDGASMTLTQRTARAVVDWDSFDIGERARVSIAQPSADAVLLNRVRGPASSTLAGTLEANGSVFLINPNGIAITPTGTVSAAGFIAAALAPSLDKPGVAAADLDIVTALGLSDRAAVNLEALPTGTVSHAGSITVRPGGTIALVGPDIRHAGRLHAEDGRILLFGHAVALTDANQMAGNALQIGGTTIDARQASIVARAALHGGRVHVWTVGPAATQRIAFGPGVDIAADASDTGGNGGAIGILSAGHTVFEGNAHARGKPPLRPAANRLPPLARAGAMPSASTPAGSGGQIEVRGMRHLTLTGELDVNAAAGGTRGTIVVGGGDIRIDAAPDPTAAGGSPRHRHALLRAASLSRALETGDLTVAAHREEPAGGHGDVVINAPLDWRADTTLALVAAGRIVVRAGVCGVGEASAVRLAHGAPGLNGYSFDRGYIRLPGARSAFSVQGADFTMVRDIAGLRAIVDHPNGLYALAQSIKLDGAPFTPITSATGRYFGLLDGLGNRIEDLHINRPGDSRVGLFRELGRGARVANLTFDRPWVVGGDAVGVLAGRVDERSVLSAIAIRHAMVGAKPGTYGAGSGSAVGSLVGQLRGQSVVRYATVSASEIKGVNDVGGLAGTVGVGSVVTDVMVGAGVGGTRRVGGIAGQLLPGGTIADAHWVGHVTGTPALAQSQDLGGIAGSQLGGAVLRSSARGFITGGSDIGGIAGRLAGQAIIRDARARTGLIGAARVGGLVGSVIAPAGLFSSDCAGIYRGADASGGVAGDRQGGVMHQVVLRGVTQPDRQALDRLIDAVVADR